MLDGESDGSGRAFEMRVTNLGTATGVDPNSGCSSGSVSQFGADAAVIYVTAQVTDLRAGAEFVVEWYRDEVSQYVIEWGPNYSKIFECIWFYVTPDDFAFAPGNYQATMYVDGLVLGSADFTIIAN